MGEGRRGEAATHVSLAASRRVRVRAFLAMARSSPSAAGVSLPGVISDTLGLPALCRRICRSGRPHRGWCRYHPRCCAGSPLPRLSARTAFSKATPMEVGKVTNPSPSTSCCRPAAPPCRRWRPARYLPGCVEAPLHPGRRFHRIGASFNGPAPARRPWSSRWRQRLKARRQCPGHPASIAPWHAEHALAEIEGNKAGADRRQLVDSRFGGTGDAAGPCRAGRGAPPRRRRSGHRSAGHGAAAAPRAGRRRLSILRW